MIPKIIVVTGVDGSGKTTQTQLLVNYFRQEKKSVGFAQQFNSETLFGKSVLKKIGGDLIKLERRVSDEPHFNSNTLKRGSALKTILRFFAIIRIVVIGLYHTWVKIFKNRNESMLIFDRYFYDDLIKVRWMYNISSRLENIFAYFVPKPTFLFYLDIPADIAHDREIGGDTTLEQHKKKKEIYDEWFDKISKTQKNAHKIYTNMDPHEVLIEIISIFKTEAV